jgi:MFS family permease
LKKIPPYILPIIIFSQFAGTSLWFAGNAILTDVEHQTNLSAASLGNITSIVQLGFIAGTLLFAVFSIADVFNPSKVFFISCFLASAANLAIIWLAKNSALLFSLRFVTGFFLAGIYPMGMKIAADWYEKGLGKALGFLVGALVLGTAFPHLLKSNLYLLPWKQVLIFTSIFACAGGLLMLIFVPDGPYRKAGNNFQPSAIFRIFRSADFRAAAFGYFGHMWELYTFWAFVPVILKIYLKENHYTVNISLWSFFIIGIGAFSCIAGGYLSQKIGSNRVAFYSLLCSGICCAVSAIIFSLPLSIFLFIMLIWGITVIADSPQFSTLVAQTSIPEYKGTALTIVTSIGFAITIASIQFINYFFSFLNNAKPVFIILAVGPITGLIFLFRLLKKR